MLAHAFGQKSRCADFRIAVAMPLLFGTRRRWEHVAMHQIDIIDSHTAGEPTRVVLSGFPDLGGGSLHARRERLTRAR